MNSLFEYVSVRDFLEEYYLNKKNSTPSFSHRVLASKVGFSNGYFSRILSGEKKLSSALVEKFVIYLKFGRSEADYFRALVIYSQSSNEIEKNNAFKTMLSTQRRSSSVVEQEQFELFHTWYHSTLFSLCHMGEITTQTDLGEIGSKLYPSVSSKELTQSLQLITKLDLVEVKNSVYTVKNQFLTSGSKHKNRHIQNYLLNSLQQAKNALLSTPQSERDISTMTISVSQSGYEEIQELVAQFKQKVNGVIAADSELDRVCQINIQQFPLYKKGKSDD